MTVHKVTETVVYELSLLQFRPDATSEEFLNIGVIAYSPDRHEFQFKITHKYKRLRSAFPTLDGSAFKKLSQNIKTRCRELSRQIESDRLELFRHPSFEELSSRIVIQGSSNFGWSSTRYGVCTDLGARVNEVYQEYIGRMEQTDIRERTDDSGLWSKVSADPKVRSVLSEIEASVELTTDLYSHVFRAGWINGRQQVVEAISLDLLDPREIVGKAVRYSGVINELRETNDFGLTAIVTNRPQGPHGIKHDQAVQVLLKIPNLRDVIEEAHAEQFGVLVEHDLQSH